MKSCCVLPDHYDDERDKTVFHNTTLDLQDQDQDHSVQDLDQDRLFCLDRSCPKTDGLRPHHCWLEGLTQTRLRHLRKTYTEWTQLGVVQGELPRIDIGGEISSPNVPSGTGGTKSK